MKVLITGGGGYLGSLLTDVLLQDTNIKKIYIVDKLLYGTAHIHSLLHGKVELVVADLADKEKYYSEINEADIVVHLASLVGAPLVNRKPSESYRVNVELTHMLTKLIGRDQKFLFASTGSCYGYVDGICDENIEISPTSSYGKHKALGEKFVQEIDGISMRFSTVYGLSPKMRNDLFIHTMLQRAIVDRSVVMYQGDAMRSFIHIRDAARAIHHLCVTNSLKHNVYNIGDPRLSITKNGICREIQKLTEFTVVENDYARDVDQRDYTVDFTRLSNESFLCEMQFDTEIRNLFKYYKAKYEAGYENG